MKRCVPVNVMVLKPEYAEEVREENAKCVKPLESSTDGSSEKNTWILKKYKEYAEEEIAVDTAVWKKVAKEQDGI